MSFEIIDNGIQVGLFLLFALFSLIQGLHMQNRRFLILAGTYASFSMGTLYYLLYLVIMGKVPQVFYVSEMAWMASYLFLLALCLMETRRYRGKLDVLVLGLTIVEAAMVFGSVLSIYHCVCFGNGMYLLLCSVGLSDGKENADACHGACDCVAASALYCFCFYNRIYTFQSVFCCGFSADGDHVQSVSLAEEGGV